MLRFQQVDQSSNAGIFGRHVDCSCHRSAVTSFRSVNNLMLPKREALASSSTASTGLWLLPLLDTLQLTVYATVETCTVLCKNQ